MAVRCSLALLLLAAATCARASNATAPLKCPVCYTGLSNVREIMHNDTRHATTEAITDAFNEECEKDNSTWCDTELNKNIDKAKAILDLLNEGKSDKEICRSELNCTKVSMFAIPLVFGLINGATALFDTLGSIFKG